MADWAASALMIWLSGLIFALSHSLLASMRCKRWCYNQGLHEPHYRLCYSIIAVAMTGVWVVFVHLLPDMPLYQSDGLFWAALVAVQLTGIMVALAAFQPIDGLVFLGLRHAKAGSDPFIERGIYCRLRHPMYAGAMLILLAMPEQSWNGFQFVLVICVYFLIGARLEERRMIVQHPEYLDYQMRVPAFIPRLHVHSATD